jgi:ankyrin repeat protein
VKEFDVDVNQFGNDERNTALSLAVQRDDLDTMNCLVKELGANVNHTFLLGAACGGNLDVVCCLVKEFGVDVNQSSNDDSLQPWVSRPRKVI